MLKKLILEELRVVSEYYDNIHKLKPKLEKMFNVTIAKVLGDESQGVAYLTDKNTVLKATPSDSEVDIAKKLLKQPNKHFPKIYQVTEIYDLWFGIHKEYIPEVTEKIRRDYAELEIQINDWVEDYRNHRMIMDKLLETDEGNGFFIVYLSDEYPDIVYLYEQLMEIANYTRGLVINEAVDIHIDNLGVRGGNIVLFDF